MSFKAFRIALPDCENKLKPSRIGTTFFTYLICGFTTGSPSSFLFFTFPNMIIADRIDMVGFLLSFPRLKLVCK